MLIDGSQKSTFQKLRNQRDTYIGMNFEKKVEKVTYNGMMTKRNLFWKCIANYTGEPASVNHTAYYTTKAVLLVVNF